MSQARPPSWLSVPVEALSVLIAASLAMLAAGPDLPAPSTAAAGLGGAALGPCGDAGEAYLRGQLHGDLQVPVDWSGATLRCAGMLRPEGDGLRLLFTSAARSAGPLIVIGLDGSPEAVDGGEVATSLTVVDQGNGRFYHSGESERCWSQASVVPDATGAAAYRVAGRVYCAGALAEVNGPGSVTPGEFEFAGLLTAADD
jgi:hypothetical protein